jgi:hypothetical protein
MHTARGVAAISQKIGQPGAHFETIQYPAAFIAAGSISFWCRLMAWRLIMTVARVMQAVVENISWHDTRLAHDSIAGVACPRVGCENLGDRQLIAPCLTSLPGAEFVL